MKFIDVFGEKIEVVVRKVSYADNGSLAVYLFLDKTYDYEPYALLTVNLQESDENEKDEAYLDKNNLPYAETFVKEYGLATPTGRVAYSGFCRYPLYKFDLARLNELEIEGREGETKT